MLRRPVEFTRYTSIAVGERCREVRTHSSTGSIGHCFDNALVESFFVTLEYECLKCRTLRSKAEGESALFQFIDDWYDP